MLLLVETPLSVAFSVTQYSTFVAYSVPVTPPGWMATSMYDVAVFPIIASNTTVNTCINTASVLLFKNTPTLTPVSKLWKQLVASTSPVQGGLPTQGNETVVLGQGWSKMGWVTMVRV